MHDPATPDEDMDPQLVMDETAESTTPAEPEPEDEEAEAALVAEMSEWLEVPTPYQRTYERFQEDREYLAAHCIPSEDDEDTVSTNYILRNQYTLIAQIYARDPQPEIRPQPMMGGAPPELAGFARTGELVVRRLAEEAGLKAKLNGALQDVQTHNIAWLKITTQQDIYKDPLGCSRQNDQLDNIARLRSMLDAYGEQEFDEDSAQYKELIDLSDTVRKYLSAEMQASQPPAPAPMVQPGMDPMAMGGAPPMDPAAEMQAGMGQPLPPAALPEVPVFIGVNIDPVLPDDMRVDWDISRPEEFYQAKRVGQRLFMSADEIRDRWQVEASDLKAAGDGNRKRGQSNSGGDEAPSDRRDLEVDRVNDRIAVWEIWDKVLGRRYVYVTGMKRFVVNEVPDVVWHKWYPYFPLIFNRVTGQFYGISDVRLQMPLQDEINLKRTHARESQKASYPRYLTKRGTLLEGEKAAIENALPYKVIEVESPQAVKDSVVELPSNHSYDPKLYDTTDPKRELEVMAGMPSLATGETGSTNTATEAAISNQHLGIQSSKRQTGVEDFLKEIYVCLMELALQLFPETNIKQLVGPGAVWPPLNRDQMWRMLALEIKAGAAGRPDAAKELADLMALVELGTRLGLVMNGVEIWKRAAELKNLPGSAERYVLGVMPPGMAGPGAPGASAGGPNSASPKPGDNTGGPRPGSPPIGQGAAAAPTPESIPNGPA